MHKGILNTLKTYLDRNRLGELLVLSGAITPHELRYALIHQKATNTPLGRVLVQEDLIRRRQLYAALAHQSALRVLTAAFTITLSMSAFGIKQAQAAGISDIPAQMSLDNVANAAFTPVAYYPSLLGSSERMSGNLKPFTKWTQMFDRFQASMDSSTGRKEIAQLKSDLEPLKGQSLRVMAEQVNAMMNKVPYIEDTKNWGSSDYWETPVEFLSRGGDCEQQCEGHGDESCDHWFLAKYGPRCGPSVGSGSAATCSCRARSAWGGRALARPGACGVRRHRSPTVPG